MTTKAADKERPYQSLTIWLAPEILDWLHEAGQKMNRWSTAEYAAWLLEEAYATRGQRDFHYGPEEPDA